MAEGKLDILFVDDEAIAHESVGRYLRKCGHRVTGVKSGHEALEAASTSVGDFDVAILDVRMPRMDGLALLEQLHERLPGLPCVICTGHADVDMAVSALRKGAADFLRKPVELLELDVVLERVMHVAALTSQNRQLRSAMRGLRASARLRSGGLQFLGKSKAAQEVQAQVMLAADAKCDTILITGATGVGKEVVAREIHDRSERAEGPFVPVNCPAIPESVLQSELFGHNKGAFTGAGEARDGYFEMANGGTLFLDEIADLTPAAQAAILRTVDTRRVRRVGGRDETPLDLCLMVASNQDLVRLVTEGKFRQDLYFRLNVFAISVPPLIDRRADIEMLASRFLEQFGKGRNLPVRSFSPSAIAALSEYDYPGNARELRNLVERACIVCRGEVIEPCHLALAPTFREQDPDALPPAGDECSRIRRALETAHWNRRKAAEALGMGYSTLREKIAKYAIR
jgi:DNA-binding NtrC family response regulator